MNAHDLRIGDLSSLAIERLANHPITQRPQLLRIHRVARSPRGNNSVFLEVG